MALPTALPRLLAETLQAGFHLDEPLVIANITRAEVVDPEELHGLGAQRMMELGRPEE